jgi:hypothetical protein
MISRELGVSLVQQHICGPALELCFTYTSGENWKKILYDPGRTVQIAGPTSAHDTCLTKSLSNDELKDFSSDRADEGIDRGAQAAKLPKHTGPVRRR